MHLIRKDYFFENEIFLSHLLTLFILSRNKGQGKEIAHNGVDHVTHKCGHLMQNAKIIYCKHWHISRTRR